MRVLVACEYSGRALREAFRELGHDAYSCDLLESDDLTDFHFKQDVIDLLLDGWDMMIAHPPCTYLTVAGLHWNKRDPSRLLKTTSALAFVATLMKAPIPRICIENPVSCISTAIRKPDQIIQPYEFGADASKKTCLWLKGLGPLPIDPAMRHPGRIVEYPVGSGHMVERWANQTDSGQNNLGPSEDRWKLRSETYPGIAKAMAAAWG